MALNKKKTVEIWCVLDAVIKQTVLPVTSIYTSNELVKVNSTYMKHEVYPRQPLHTLCTAVFLRHKCQQFYVSDKNINNSDKKDLSYSQIYAILCSLISVYTLFYLISENMSTKGRKCYIWHLWRPV